MDDRFTIQPPPPGPRWRSFSVAALSVAALAACPLVFGCIQEWDSRAAKATNEAPVFDPNHHTEVIETPPIAITSSEEEGGGETVATACELLEFQVLGDDARPGFVRQDCGHCHGGGPGEDQGNFSFVLDKDKLIDPATLTAPDPLTGERKRFVIPGDPTNSRLYARVAAGEMPKPDIPGLPKNPRPSISDISVLYQWITSCLGAEGGGGAAGNGGGSGAATGTAGPGTGGVGGAGNAGR